MALQFLEMNIATEALQFMCRFLNLQTLICPQEGKKTLSQNLKPLNSNINILISIKPPEGRYNSKIITLLI